jgi:hypothetical protein
MKLPLTLLTGLLMSFATASHATGATIGPLPYNDIADSPFDLSRLDVDFFLEDFSTELTRIVRDAGPGAPIRMTKFSTPGVLETTGDSNSVADPNGGALYATSRYIDFSAGTEAVNLSFEFDVGELGRLPQAVGIKISNFAPITVNFFADDGALIESLFAPTAPLPPGPQPTGLARALEHYFRYRLLGAIELAGIARVTISSPTRSLIIDDFQYGQQVPEPISSTLALGMSLGLTVICGRYRRRVARG